LTKDEKRESSKTERITTVLEKKGKKSEGGHHKREWKNLAELVLTTPLRLKGGGTEIEQRTFLCWSPIWEGEERIPPGTGCLQSMGSRGGKRNRAA